MRGPDSALTIVGTQAAAAVDEQHHTLVAIVLKLAHDGFAADNS